MATQFDAQFPDAAEAEERIEKQDLQPIAPGAQLHVMIHALGLPLKRGQKEPYRNYFVTGPGCNNFEACEELVALGYMKKSQNSFINQADFIYSITELGMKALKAPLPGEIRFVRGDRLDLRSLADNEEALACVARGGWAIRRRGR